MIPESKNTVKSQNEHPNLPQILLSQEVNQLFSTI